MTLKTKSIRSTITANVCAKFENNSIQCLLSYCVHTIHTAGSKWQMVDGFPVKPEYPPILWTQVINTKYKHLPQYIITKTSPGTEKSHFCSVFLHTFNQFSISYSLLLFNCIIIRVLVWWRHMATEIWVNIGSANNLLPDGTKPLPEPLLTNHCRRSMSFIWGQFHRKHWEYLSVM